MPFDRKTVSTITLLLAFFSFHSVSANTDIVNGAIISDTVWSPGNGVYVIHGPVVVAYGATLTIEPGTIIKSQTGGGAVFNIYGSLVAHGDATNPIYLTSINDDSIGGDTLGDGNTTASPKDWQGLYIYDGASADLDYVNLLYGGYGGDGFGDFVGVENDGGNLKINHSVISNNNQKDIWQKKGQLDVESSVISSSGTGIFIGGGEAVVSDNEIKNNSGLGLQSNTSSNLAVFRNQFLNNGATAYINAQANFSHLDNKSEDLSKRGFEISGVLKDSTTLKGVGDLPFIVNEGIIVNAGTNVIIAPGTIIKFGGPSGSGYLNILGSLDVQGTNEAPVYLTSLRDDSVGGDTNGDGPATLPVRADWEGIEMSSGSSVNFKHTLIEYAGMNFNGPLVGIAALIYNHGGNLNFEDSFLGHHIGAGIFQTSGTTTAIRSEFTDGQSALLFRGGQASLSQSSIHAHSNYSINNQTGLSIGAPVDPTTTVDARNNWWGGDTGPRDALNSNSTGTGDLLSINVLFDPWLKRDPTLKLSPVIIIPGIMGSAEKNGVWVIDPILHVYDNLIDTFVANGYVKGKTLFPFPYDWRKSNVDTGVLLKNKIDEVKAICQCSKVDVIAHSMGGLVARSYVESPQYAHDIDNLIFLGTPHRGAPTDYLTWEAGEFAGISEPILKVFFTFQSIEKNFSDLFDYIHNYPISTVQELLPVHDYLKLASTGDMEHYPSGYPRNIFLENLNQNISNLLESGIKIKNIIGNSGSNTISTIRINASSTRLWIDGRPDGFGGFIGDNGLERGEGDETVPIWSSTLSSSTDIVVNSTHKALPTVEESYVYNLLTGLDVGQVINHGTISRLLVTRVQSPADIMIIAPDGKRVGRDPVTGQEVNEIPGAFYTGFDTNEEFITIPDPIDGEYKVQSKGIGAGGEYTLVSSNITDDTSAETSFTGNIESNQVTTLGLTVSSNATSSVNFIYATASSTISDINKAFDLGWIFKKNVRDELIQKLNQTIKFEKKIVTVAERRGGDLIAKKVEKIQQRIDKTLLRALSTLLRSYKKDKMNDQAYNMINADLEWLINN